MNKLKKRKTATKNTLTWLQPIDIQITQFSSVPPYYKYMDIYETQLFCKCFVVIIFPFLSLRLSVTRLLGFSHSFSVRFNCSLKDTLHIGDTRRSHTFDNFPTARLFYFRQMFFQFIHFSILHFISLQAAMAFRFCVFRCAGDHLVQRISFFNYKHWKELLRTILFSFAFSKK